MISIFWLLHVDSEATKAWLLCFFGEALGVFYPKFPFWNISLFFLASNVKKGPIYVILYFKLLLIFPSTYSENLTDHSWFPPQN